MIIPGFQIEEAIHEDSLYRAKRLPDGMPVLLKRLPLNRNGTRLFNRNKNDYLVSIGLGLGGSCSLKPIEFNDSGDSPYVVYEYFDGEPLSRLNEKRTLTTIDAVRISLSLVDALDEIHSQGIVHRNLCSRDIFVNRNTLEVRLSDFRFALRHSSVEDAHDEFETTELALDYVSPEMTGRIRQDADYRSDYYSLGIVLYEMLCGKLPFEASAPLEMIHRHLAQQPEPLLEVDSGSCPRPLSDLVMKLISKIPADRYQSIVGIKHDLGLCLEGLEKEGTIAAFPLAEYDFSTRFTMPTTLYGRGEELSQLEACLDGHGGFVSVHGAAGTGKTALMKAFSSNNMANARFLSGKYEQYDALVPYSGFIRIIEKLTTHLLAENKASFARYKAEVEDALGSNADIIVDLVPRFEAIVGKKDRPLLLGVAETKNRFRMAFSSLFSVFSKKGYPLVIILDDLQWVDNASLSLLGSLFDGGLEGVLVVGCHRDALTDGYPDLQELLKNLSERENSVDIIVGNLSFEDVSKLLFGTLSLSGRELESLTDYVYKVTAGNAFYTKQYIYNLYHGGSIWADSDSQKWRWDHRELEDEGGGVLSLIEEELDRLNKKQQTVLHYGIFLGNHFTLRNVSIIMELQEEEVLRDVLPLVRSGIVINNGEEFHFKHDCVQQAIASSIPRAEMEAIHLRMGRRFTESLSGPEKDNRLFEITNYFTKAEALLDDEDECSVLLLLSYRSGVKALENSAYSIAYSYAKKASSLLSKVADEFRQTHEFEVKILLGRCQYLTAGHESAQRTLDEILKAANTFEEECLCYSVFKDILVSEVGDYDKAVSVGLQILKQGQTDLPFYSNEKELSELLGNLKNRAAQLSKGKSAGDFLNASRLNDPDKKRLLGLLVDLWEAAYYAADEGLMQYCILQNVVLSMEYGNCSESAFGYVLYGMELTLDDRYLEAYEFGRLALDLNEEFGDRVMLPKVTNLFCNYINFHVKPFSSSVVLYEESSRVGRENGDYLFGLWATFFVVWSRFLSGQPLREVNKEIDRLQGFVRQTRDSKMIYAYRMLRDVIESLRGKDEGGGTVSLSDHEGFVNYWLENGFLPGVSWHAILLGQYYCIMGDYEKAYRLLAQKQLSLSPLIVMFPHTQYCFYYALSSLKLINSKKLSATPEIVSKIDENIARLKGWAELCPENFLYQQRLLEAERGRLEGKLWDAGVAYDRAMVAAEESELMPAIALCSEAASDFWEEAGNRNLAGFYRQSALDHYSRWGAGRKTAVIESQLSGKQLRATVQATGAGNPNEGGLKNVNEKLDFKSILNFTQAISEEIDDARLLKMTMEIVMENAGADKGVLLTYDNDEARVRAVGVFGEKLRVRMIDVPLEDFEDLPKRVIYYVERTKERIIFDDASQDEIVGYSKYLRRGGCRSVLCLPIVYKDKLRVILYLENSSTSGVFSPQRADALRILLVQTAISKQNADLYHFLGVELEKRKQTTEELKRSEDRLRLSYEFAAVGVWDLDVASGRILLSDNSYPMFGYDKGEVDSTFENFFKTIHRDDREVVEKAIKACLDGGDEYKVEFRVIWEDGTERWIFASGDAVREETGRPLRMLGVVKDITERKDREKERLQLEKQLLQAQKMEAIGELTGGIAHDFNNMLSVVIGSTEMLKENIAGMKDPSLAEFLENILISATRASDLTMQMLSFSREENAEIKSMDITPVVQDVIRMLSSMVRSSVKISFRSNPNLPRIDANPVQLSQVVMNICINARDAMGEHGEIKLELKYHDHYSGVCSSCHNEFSDKYVELVISDSGGGVPSDIRDSIFNPFFSTKEVGEGSGMGLAMVHGIMHAYHGHVVLDVSEGYGSQFSLCFLVSKQQNIIENPTTITRIDEKATQGYRVLVVDDEPVVAKMTKASLVMAGCLVTVCSDSTEALRVIEEDLDQFDVMISDQTMPNITGAELATRAMELNPSFPVILCTGFSAHVNQKVASDLGIKKLLMKPVRRADLLKALEEVMP